MIRIKTTDGCGWTSLEKNENSLLLEKKINENIIALQKLEKIKPKSIEIIKTNEVLIFHIINNCSSSIDMNVISRNTILEGWKSEGIVLWKKQDYDSNEDSCNVTYIKQSVYTHNSNICAIYDYNQIQICTKQEWKQFQNKKYIGYFEIVVFEVYIVKNCISVFFTPSISCGKIHTRSGVSCVNSCYTGTIVGNFDVYNKELDNPRFFHVSDVKGPCGSGIIIKCISLGVVHIFSSQQGMRRITCKAFLNKKDADLMLKMISDQFFIQLNEFIVPHMIVLFGYIGRQVDISTSGYIRNMIQKFFPAVDFTSIIEELNIHIIFKWDNLFSLYTKLVTFDHLNTEIQKIRHEIIKYAHVSTYLNYIKLCMSVTCRGTCIYRIGISSSTNIPNQVFQNDDLEITIKHICSFLHIITSS